MEDITCPGCGKVNKVDPWPGAYACWNCGERYIICSEVQDPTNWDVKEQASEPVAAPSQHP